MDKKVRIETNYGDYEPSFDVKALVNEMLTVVPEVLLKGLDRIELKAKANLSRRERRRRTRRRGRVSVHENSLGYYHPGDKSSRPYIGLYVDSLDQQASMLPWPFRGFLRDADFSETLFHEIGHHIHYTKRREFREKENVADDYADYYKRKYLRKKLWYLRYPLFPVRLIVVVRRIVSSKARKAHQKRRRRRHEMQRIEAELCGQSADTD